MVNLKLIENGEIDNLRVVIYGASIYGNFIKSILETYDNIEVAGFIDDNKEAYSKFNGVDILGDFSKLEFLKKEDIHKVAFSIGYSNMTSRGELYHKIKGLGFDFLNVIHPSAIIDKNVNFGSGIFIRIGAVIDANVEVHDNVMIDIGTLLAHDVKIHENVFIAGGAMLAGFVEVNEGTFIGAGSTIIDRIKIGKNAVVGAGAVVVKDVPDNAVVLGVPARIVRYN